MSEQGKPRFAQMEFLAGRALLSQAFGTFPVNPYAFVQPGLCIVSLRDYARTVGIRRDCFAAFLAAQDGFVAKEVRPGVNLIFYNEDKDVLRARHTLWHEIGHVVAEHCCHGPCEEIEAHFFAARAAMPCAVLAEIERRGYTLGEQRLQETFLVSREATCSTLAYWRKNKGWRMRCRHEQDEEIVKRFAAWLDVQFPKKAGVRES